MAIVIKGKTRCSICNCLIGDNEAYVSFPHFIHDADHPFWRYSDSAVHRVCFASWPHAEAFRDLFHTLWPELMPSHPRFMREDGLIVGVVNEDAS